MHGVALFISGKLPNENTAGVALFILGKLSNKNTAGVALFISGKQCEHYRCSVFHIRQAFQ